MFRLNTSTLTLMVATALLIGCSRGTGEHHKGTRGKDFPVSKTDQQWRQELTDLQYRVTREHATEPAFTGEYWNTKTPGVYACVCCGEKLFHSRTKFDSGTGWPSFYAPVDEDAVGKQKDRSFFMTRTEVHCSNCGAHLGHVFDDGPNPTGLRYCVNSASLTLLPEEGHSTDEE
jgi:peptide-methionine (R)-S-oxide reductase